MEQTITFSEPSLLIGAQTVAVLRSIARTAMTRAPEVASRLLGEIDRAEVVDETDLPADVVTLGSFVTYQILLSGSINTVQVVRPHEADVAQLRVSVASGLGTALIGLAPGQKIECDFGGRRYVLGVVRVSKEP